ncbi:hypothetical protein FRC02_011285 [Tulasnella sp. 418]|nr:hypothetical protein FRC02_011285 [Tulasnella sp. 418]
MDKMSDVSIENVPPLQVDASTTDTESNELSSMYEADLSSHIASVAWPRRPMDIEDYRPPSVYSFHESR